MGISAMVRNRKGVDVNRLMESAAARRDVEIKSKHVYKQAADSECFKVMLDAMSSNSGRKEFDNIVQTTTTRGEQLIQGSKYGKEYHEQDQTSENLNRSQNISTKQTSKTSKSPRPDMSEYGISMHMTLKDPPIAVSPIEKNGKHGTVF